MSHAIPINGALTEAIGPAAAIWPIAWLGLFGSDLRMLARGAAYRRAVGAGSRCG